MREFSSNVILSYHFAADVHKERLHVFDSECIYCDASFLFFISRVCVVKSIVFSFHSPRRKPRQTVLPKNNNKADSSASKHLHKQTTQRRKQRKLFFFICCHFLHCMVLISPVYGNDSMVLTSRVTESYIMCGVAQRAQQDISTT